MASHNLETTSVADGLRVKAPVSLNNPIPESGA